jgi:hypothetical protein
MNKISSQERSALIRLASGLPAGDDARRAILAGLLRIAGPYKPSGGKSCHNQDCGGVGKPGKGLPVYDLLADYGDHKGTDHDPQENPAGYMRWWREHQGQHKDRKVCPTGAGNQTFDCSES